MRALGIGGGGPRVVADADRVAEQTSARRLARRQAHVDAALAGLACPSLAWALVVRDSAEKTRVEVMPRGALIRWLEHDADVFLTDGDLAKHHAVRDIIARVNRNPTKIPQLVMFWEGGVELWFATEEGA